MSDVNANIKVNVDTTTALRQLEALQAKVTSMGRSAQGTSMFDAKSVGKEIPKLEAQFSGLQRSIDRNMLSMRESFKMGIHELKQFGTRIESTTAKAGKSLGLAEARARKFSDALKVIRKNGIQLDDASLKQFTQQASVTNQRLQIMNKTLNQAATGLINWGKNVQWAGRQLMVGLTLPLTIFGATAAAVFKDLDREIVNFKRVYGDLGTSAEETDRITDSVKELSVELTKYGQSVQQTLELSGDIAATGATGDELISRTIATTKLATLGMIDQRQAMDATISMQSAFAMSNQELAESVDFLNAVENQTVLSLEDVTAAIPRAATVVRGLGGDIKDMAVLLTAMREGGVQAVDGANALKSGLARLITPTKNASEAAAQYGINLNKMIEDNRGDLMGLLDDFGNAISTLDDFGKQEVLSKVFGKYQFARFSALFNSLADDASQAQRALDLLGYSAEDLAALSEKELGAVSQSIGVQFTASIERFKAALAPVGEQILKIITPVINFATSLLEGFNKLPDFTKYLVVFGAAIAALIGPFVMFIGLMGNFAGNIAKGLGQVVKFFQVIKGGGDATKYLTEAQQDLMIEEKLLAPVMDRTSNAARGQAAAYAQAADMADRLARSQRNLRASTGVPQVGGPLPMKFASGGRVPGSGNTDKVPALLTPGEFVINKGAAAGNGQFLKALNNGSVQKLAKGSQDFVGGYEDRVSGVTSGSHTSRVMNQMATVFKQAIIEAFIDGGEQGAEQMAQKLDAAMEQVIAKAEASGEELRTKDISNRSNMDSLASQVGMRGTTERLHLAHDRGGLFERGVLPGAVEGSRGALIDTSAMQSIVSQIEKTGGTMARSAEQRLTAMSEFNALLQTINNTLGLTDTQFGIFGEALSNSVLNLPADVNRLAASGNITGNQALQTIQDEGVGWRSGTSTLRQQLYDAEPADMTEDERAEYRAAVDQYAEDYWNGMIEQLRAAGDSIITDPIMDDMAAVARSDAESKIVAHADHIKQAHDMLGQQVAEIDGSLQYFDAATGKWLNQKEAMAKYIQDVAKQLGMSDLVEAEGITKLDDFALLLEGEIDRINKEGGVVSKELQTTYDQLKRVSLQGKGGVISVDQLSSSVKALDSSERKPQTANNYSTYAEGTLGPAVDAKFKEMKIKSSKAAREAAMDFIRVYQQVIEQGFTFDDEAMVALSQMVGLTGEIGEDAARSFLQNFDKGIGRASPSAEMHERGVDINRGLAQGMEASRALAVGEAAETADAIKAEIMSATAVNPTGTGYPMPVVGGMPGIYMGSAGSGAEAVKDATDNLDDFSDTTKKSNKMQKNSLQTLTRFSYAITGLTTMTALLPNKFQELAQKLVSATFAFTGVIQMLDVLDDGNPLKKAINKLASDMFTGAGKVKDSVKTGFMVPLDGTKKALTSFKNKLGPIGRMFDAIVDILKKLTRGKGLLALVSLAIAATAGVAGMKKFNDALGDLAKAAQITSDQMEDLAGQLGFSVKQIGRLNGVGGTSQEEVDLNVKAKEAAATDTDRVKKVAGATDQQAAAILKSLYVDMVAQGAPQDVAEAFVEAIGEKAGKAGVFVPFNIEFNDDGNIENFDEVLKNSLVPSMELFQEQLNDLDAEGGVFGQEGVERLGLINGLVQELPDGMSSMIPGLDAVKEKFTDTTKEGKLLAATLGNLYNLASSEFGTTGNTEEFRARLAAIRAELDKMEEPQALWAVQEQLRQLYPQVDEAIGGIANLEHAIVLSEAAAAGYNVSGMIARLDELGWKAEETASKIAQLQSLMAQLGVARAGVTEAEQNLAKAQAAQTELLKKQKKYEDWKKNNKKGGGGGGSKDPFADRENQLRDALAEIELEDIKIDEGATDRFVKDLEERLKADPIEMPLDIDGEPIDINNVADAQYAIEQMGEEIEELEKKMKPFEDQIAGIEDEIEPAQVRVNEINADIADQKDLIEDVKDEYAALIDPLQDQKDALNDIVDSLEDQRDAAAEPFEERIKLLEDTLKMEQYAIDKQNDAYDDQIDSLNDQKDSIDDRIEALNKVAKINDYIAKQQKNQLSLADALSSGDIGAAAEAQAQAQQDAAEMASDLQRDRLDDSKDALDDEIDIIEEQKELLQERIDAIEEEIKDQEHLLWLTTKTFDEQIDAQEKLIKGVDKQIEAYEKARDAAIEPYQKIIDDYGPELRNLQNFIRDKEAEIDKIRRDNIEPLQEAIDLRKEDQEALEDIIDDSESYTNRLKEQNQQKREQIALDQRRLAAEKELANLSSGGGGGGGGSAPEMISQEDLDAAAAAVAEAEEMLKNAQQQVDTLESDIKELIGTIQDAVSWWESMMDKIATFFESVATGIAMIEGFFVRFGKTVAAIFMAIFGDQIRGMIDGLKAKVLEWVNSITAAWNTLKEWVATVLEYIKIEFPAVFAIIEAGIIALAAVWDVVKTAFQTAMNAMKDIWKLWWSWAGVNGIDKMEQDIKNFWETKFPGIIEDAKAYLKEKFDETVGLLKEAFDSFSDDLYSMFVGKDSIWSKIEGAATKMFGNVAAAAGKALKAVIKEVVRGINAIKIEPPSWIPGNLSYSPNITLPFNKGGIVPGAGNRDTVPAMLTPGEFVITKASAQSLGMPMLNALNEGKFPVAQEMPTARGGIMNDITNNVSNNYNNVSVNAAGVNADDVANVVMRKLADLNRQNIGGN